MLRQPFPFVVILRCTTLPFAGTLLSLACGSQSLAPPPSNSVGASGDEPSTGIVEASPSGTGAEPAEPPTVLRRSEAQRVHKFGIELDVHEVNRATEGRAGLVRVSTEFGHHQEFLDVESTFIYTIEDGSGVFMISGRPYVVGRGDVLVIPPNNSIYYAGRLEMQLLTVPAWRAENEREIRRVERSELDELIAASAEGASHTPPTPGTNDAPEAPVLLHRDSAESRSLRWFDLVVYDVHGVTDGRVGLAHEVTELGHEQEFINRESTHIYSVVDGSGVFMIDGSPYVVGAGDVLVIPPKNPIYFAGRLEMLLINLPALDVANQREIRLVGRSELESLVETHLARSESP